MSADPSMRDRWRPYAGARFVLRPQYRAHLKPSSGLIIDSEGPRREAFAFWQDDAAVAPGI